jgi:hypothetical protein
LILWVLNVYRLTIGQGAAAQVFHCSLNVPYMLAPKPLHLPPDITF